jgi:hypothetical protein
MSLEIDSVAVATYVLNFIASIALLSSKAEAAGSTFGVALVIMLIGVPVAFAFWYRSIYEGKLLYHQSFYKSSY